MGGRRGVVPLLYIWRRCSEPYGFVRVGLVSRELANDRGMPDAFFGTAPVCRYCEYTECIRDDGEVLREVAGKGKVGVSKGPLIEGAHNGLVMK